MFQTGRKYLGDWANLASKNGKGEVEVKACQRSLPSDPFFFSLFLFFGISLLHPCLHTRRPPLLFPILLLYLPPGNRSGLSASSKAVQPRCLACLPYDACHPSVPKVAPTSLAKQNLASSIKQVGCPPGNAQLLVPSCYKPTYTHHLPRLTFQPFPYINLDLDLLSINISTKSKTLRYPIPNTRYPPALVRV